MKKIKYYLATAAIVALAAACSEERMDMQGQGAIAIATSVSTDMDVVSRAVEQDLVDACKVWISSSKGMVRYYDKLADVPSKIDLIAGHYVAEACTGDSASADFDKRYFKGYAPFDVTAGQTAKVDLVCKIANSAVSVRYAEGLESVLSDFSMTVGHKKGLLVFNGRDERRGYYMMPSYDKNLKYELRGTQIDGKEFVLTGVIEDAQPATEYVLNVEYTAKVNEIGGAVFSIKVDKTEINVETEIRIVAAPVISGYDFDIASGLTGEAGSFGRKSIYITSATSLKSVELQSDLFNKIAALGGNDFDFLNQTAQGYAAIEAEGINWKMNYDAEADETVAQINFEEAFMDALTDGDYSIMIKATDARGQQSQQELKISVSNAPVLTLPYAVPAEPVFTTATLRGIVSKDGIQSVGFNYRAAGAADWTYIEGTAASRAFAAGTEFYAELTGLKDGTTYEYTAVADGFVSPAIKSFATEKYPQLPNCGFEEWSGAKPMYVAASSSDFFWDSGNHGSKSAGQDLTTNDSSIKHSGKYSARLEGKNLMGVFAAGNLFVGSFTGTENITKGILGWGRPFDFKALPRQMKIWVKYSPQAQPKSDASLGVNAGDLDNGAIYIALLDDSKMEYKGKQWPVIVRTADLANYSFKKDAANVIAYGERILTEATPGDGMIEVTIDIDYRDTRKPSNILVVCAASRYGDYYIGAPGSTMWVDDVELVY